MDEVYIKTNSLSSHIQKKYFNNKDIITIDDLISTLEDVDSELEELDDKYTKLEQDLEDNYVSRPMSDYTGDRYDDRF